MRPENQSYQKLMEARHARNEEWPEPETREFYGVLRRAALAIVGSICAREEPELAGEIVTRTLLRLDSFRGESEFSTWFYRLAKNEALRVLGQESSRGEIQLDILEEQLQAPPIPEPLALPLILTETDREICKLLVQGFTRAEIARSLGITPKTVYNHILHLRELFNGQS